MSEETANYSKPEDKARHELINPLLKTFSHTSNINNISF